MKPSLNRDSARRWWDWALRLLHLGLLRCASVLVPGRQRAEWAREWRAELWHVRQACSPVAGNQGRGEREVTAFCLGAFQDALCLRRAGRQWRLPLARLQGTPNQCILILAAMLAASYAMALLLPGVRAERNLWPRKLNPNLVLIEREGSSGGSVPTIAPRLFRSWQRRKQKYFDGFAFYRVSTETVSQEPQAGVPRLKAPWAVARASRNIFTLLGLPLELEDPGEASIPEVILSERVWKRDFAADPRIAGAVVTLGGHTTRIAGIAPDGSLELPGKVDAWLLEADAGRETGGAGYVVAHLTAMGAAEMWASCVHITANGPDDSEEDLLGVSLDEWRPAPRSLYLFALLLALLSLPAITSVSLGEYSVNPQGTSWTRKLQRWSFLAAKVALMLPVIYFVSIDLAYGSTGLTRERACLIQLASTFVMCLFGLCWALKDQRQRCPVCLHRVAHPAQVGQASRTFLHWNGTEMMCMGGHTLLHVPSLPTSWFSSQRWLYLDTSWKFLFAEPSPPTP